MWWRFFAAVQLVIGCHLAGCDDEPDPVDRDGDGFDETVDCDDGDAARSPGLLEVCDGVDNDCDGDVDDGVAIPAFFADEDGDGFGRAEERIDACVAPEGYVSRPGDCDDGDEAINPEAAEICDEVDNDCDGETDEDSAVDAPTWYRDVDRDGFGDEAGTIVACGPPEGYAGEPGDCNDAAAWVSPDEPELCDGVDNDCDGETDEPDAAGAPTWYRDIDDDGYGDADTATVACAAPEGHVADDRDCDDSAAAVNPGATEVCDGLDNDCDGIEDEADAADAATWYWDFDDDGYGDSASTTLACAQPEGFAAEAGDCDDADASRSPGLEEVCDNFVDDDCDGLPDDGCPIVHCGDVTEDETWSAENPHVVACTVTVQGADGPTLTVEEGAVVSFAAATRLAVGVVQPGTLIVRGGDEGVLFTSAEDEPEAGAFDGVWLGPEQVGSELVGLTLEHAGTGGGGGGAISLSGASPLVDGCTVRLSAASGLLGRGPSFPIVRGSTFTENAADGVALEGEAGLGRECPVGSEHDVVLRCCRDGSDQCVAETAPSFASNVLTGNGGFGLTVTANSAGQIAPSTSVAGNGAGGVRIVNDYVETDATWPGLDAEYHLSGNVYVEGDAAPVLVIEEGAVLTVGSDIGLFVGEGGPGGLTAEGGVEGVLFTSSADPAAAGDWYGISFGPSCLPESSLLVDVVVEHAGGSGLGSVIVACDATLRDGIVRHSASWGVFVVGGAAPTIEGMTFADNASGDVGP